MILLKNTVNQMVYKHAISTVVPARSVAHHNANQQQQHQGQQQETTPAENNVEAQAE